MAFVDDLRRSEAQLVSSLRDGFTRARQAYLANQKFRQTFAELNALSDRDLADLNIARADIRRLAHEVARGK